MKQRLYCIDDEMNLDWVEVKETPVVINTRGSFRCAPYYEVVAAKNGYTGFNMYVSWVHSKTNTKGVWHKTVESLAIQMREKAKEIESNQN